jgi:hypothetical protein
VTAKQVSSQTAHVVALIVRRVVSSLRHPSRNPAQVVVKQASSRTVRAEALIAEQVVPNLHHPSQNPVQEQAQRTDGLAVPVPLATDVPTSPYPATSVRALRAYQGHVAREYQELWVVVA